MPQMAPINWLTLYLIFISMFLIFIILSYFSFFYKPKLISKIKQIKIINWKW